MYHRLSHFINLSFHVSNHFVITCVIAPTEPPQNIKVQSAGPGELMVSWQVKVYYI